MAPAALRGGPSHAAAAARSGHLAALDGSYGYLRQFTPQVLAAVRFAGGTAASGLLEAVEILRDLNATGARRVPNGAPEGFVPARWRGYLETAATSGNPSTYRHYWELCTLLALRDGLRSGNVFVPGSRRYSDPAAYLLTLDKWADQRAGFCRWSANPPSPSGHSPRPRTNWARRSVSWRMSWPPGTARCAWMRPVIW